MANNPVFLGMAELNNEGSTTGYDRNAPQRSSAPEEVELSQPMTIAQLISVLGKFPKDLRVFVRGYEGGLSNPTIREPVEVNLDVNKGSSVYGWHEEKRRHTLHEYETITGLVIDRN